MAVLSASTIFAPGRKPPKSEIIQYLEMLQGTGSNPAVVKDTKAALDLVTPTSENYGGIVLDDPDPTKNGYYYRDSAAWVKGRGLPDSIAKVTLDGTADAQTGLASGVNPADIVCFFAVVATDNTGPMTLSIASETPRDVVNAAGNALSAGEWTGAVLFFLNADGDYQLLISPGAEAAAAQSATDAADSLAEFTSRYLGAFADDAAANAAAGGTPITGAEYWNTTSDKRKTYDGAVWVENTIALSNGDVTESKLASALSLRLANVCSSRTALKAVDTTRYAMAYLAEAGREGMFKWTTGDLSASVTADADEGIYVKADAIAATSGAWVRVFDGPVNVKWFGAKGDGSQDDSGAIQAALDLSYNVFFPAGQYNIHTTLQARNSQRFIGAVPQSQVNSGGGLLGSEVILYGVVANLGNGGAIIKLSSTDVAGNSIVFQNLTFYGDANVNPASLNAATSTGPVGVDVDHIKNGLEFIQCEFRNLRHAIVQADEEPYLDKVTFSRCHFHRLYQAVEGKPTAGFSFDNCWFYECRDFVDAHIQDVLLVGCSFNNSSYSAASKVRGRKIVMIGGYIEGPTHILCPTQYCKMDGVVTWSAKIGHPVANCLIAPANNNVSVIAQGVSMATNMRLISFANVTTISTIFMRVEGQGGDGAGFAEGSDSIATYTASGLKYRGFGNQNNSGWNTTFG